MTAAVLAAVAICYLWVFPYHADVNNPNENVRMYLTKAIVEQGTFTINALEEEYGWINDKAIVGKTLYAAKAPGASFLGVPVYALARWINSIGSDEPLRKTQIIYWLRMGTVVVPSILFLLVFFGFTSLFTPSLYLRLLATTGLGLGTMTWTYGEIFAGHAIMTNCVFCAFMAIHALGPRARERIRAARLPRGLDWIRRAFLRDAPPLLLAGVLAAWGIVTEYPAAVMCLILGVYAFSVLVAGRPRGSAPGRLLVAAAKTGWMALGGLGPLLLLMWYQNTCFGSPLATPYGFLENVGFAEQISPGFLGIAKPSLFRLLAITVSSNEGLFWFSPWLAFCTLILPLAILRRGHRPAGLLALAVITVHVLYNASLTVWSGGWTVGPRYIMQVGPFLCIGGLAGLEALRWSRRWSWLLAAAALSVLASIVIMGSSTITFPHFPEETHNPVFELALPFLLQGYTVHNAGHLIGIHGWASMLPMYAAVAGLCAYLLAGPPHEVVRRRLLLAASSLLATAFCLMLMSNVTSRDEALRRDNRQFIASVWEPPMWWRKPPPLPSPVVRPEMPEPAKRSLIKHRYPDLELR